MSLCARSQRLKCFDLKFDTKKESKTMARVQRIRAKKRTLRGEKAGKKLSVGKLQKKKNQGRGKNKAIKKSEE